MAILRRLISTTQGELFPLLERHLDQPLSAKLELFVMTVELAEPERWIDAYEWQRQGRPRHLRLSLALAFMAKAVLNLPTTRSLIDYLSVSATLRRLCGWERRDGLPSEATFSRAFAELAVGEFPQRVHQALVRAQLGENLVGHLSGDATDIVAREKAQSRPKPQAPPLAPGRKRRPRGSRPPKRLDLQGARTLAENLAELPGHCDRGCKRNSKGDPYYWVGYKLHLETTDGGVPVSAILTSASLHDSQAAIPLAQMSAQRVTALYELKDSAYDAGAIHAFARRLGHVPIIDPAGRGKTAALALAPAQAQRYKERTAVERAYSDLKDNHGGRTVRVRGAVKVMAHLGWGLLAVTCKALVAMLTPRRM
jgi:hypothetical protein